MNTDYLSTINSHDRDKHITFDEGPHIYTIDGDCNYTSVTTWNHSHFEPFNTDTIIDNMMRGKNWTSSQYYGMSKQQIKEKWDLNRNEAASAGTKIHYDIECYYNNNVIDNDSIEYTYFKNFKEDYKNLTPYRTEWMIYDKQLKLAGSIDMIFINNNGEYEIYDWKRCKEIKKKSYGKKAKTHCISHIIDSNFWHYALQLNTYKSILEKNYGIKISKMCLVCLHPNNINNSYLHYEVPDLSKELNELFTDHLLKLNNNSLFVLNNLKQKQLNCLKKYAKYKKSVENAKKELESVTLELIGEKSEVEVVIYKIKDKEYLVEEETNVVYDDDGKKIGYYFKENVLLF